MGGMGVDMGDGGFRIRNNLYGKNIVKKFRIKVFGAGWRSRNDRSRLRIQAQLDRD